MGMKSAVHLSYNAMQLGRSPYSLSEEHIATTFGVEEYTKQETRRNRGKIELKLPSTSADFFLLLISHVL
jgi:hypothetical protein